MKKSGREWNEWKARVNVRDNFLCQYCGKKGSEAHHKKPWVEYPSLRFDINNGITLCLDCHRKVSKGRPKEKNGKNAMFFLDVDSIQKLKEISYKKGISMSKILEQLINNHYIGI